LGESHFGSSARIWKKSKYPPVVSATLHIIPPPIIPFVWPFNV
jgi:hypothetical protein